MTYWYFNLYDWLREMREILSDADMLRRALGARTIGY